MRKILILCIGFLNAEVFEGYTLFTPGAGNGGACTTYLIDNNLNKLNIINKH